MEYRTGLVHEFEEARPGLKQAISSESHRHALDAGSDVPAEKPRFEAGLDAVGICNKKVWVLLPQGRICFEAEITVDLPSGLRGIHMSRMEQAVTELYDKEFRDLRQYAERLAASVLELQDGTRSRVELRGFIPHLWKTAASSRVSIDSVEISATSRAKRAGGHLSRSSSIGLRVNHITACPCTQVYSRAIFGENASSAPMPTHSQRSSTLIRVHDSNSTLSYHDLLDTLTNALTVTQDLLKRPDEAEIVLRAHNRPQFAEDAVREVAALFGKRFASRLPENSEIIIESISLESIHTHNVVCRMKTTAGRLLELLQT